MSNSQETTTLVSLFHTSEHAMQALRDLQTAGIPVTAIQTVGSTAEVTPERSMATLQALDLPAQDLRVISEGLKNGGSLLIVRAEQAMAEKAEDVFERYNASQIDERTIGQPLGEVKARAASITGETMIPIVEEQLVVGKRKVQSGGLRVFSRLVETPVQEEVTLQEEHARIERHAVDRPISPAELDALQNQTVEVRETAEEAVVGKSARVVQEISIGKETTERTQQISDTVRKTQVEVDELTAAEIKTGQPKTSR